MIYFLTYPLLWIVITIGLGILGRMSVKGRERVPKTGGLIYCPNHISDMDPPALLVAFPRRAWFIGKQELFEIPFAGWFFHHFHAFPIRRGAADRKALHRAEECLKRGEPILLFPEGRIAPDGILQPLMPGAAMLAVRAGVPLVPVGIRHTRGVLPHGTLRPRYSREAITIEFGDPIYPSAFADLPRSRVLEALDEKLGAELARLTNQAPPPLRKKERKGVDKDELEAMPAGAEV